MTEAVRRILLLAPDQLSLDYPAFAAIDPDHDLVVQIEAPEDFTHVPSHKQRTVLFLAAMRHFADTLAAAGYRRCYVALDDPDHSGSLGAELERLIRNHEPESLVMIRPGDWRTLETVKAAASQASLPLESMEDPHFLVAPQDFSEWAAGRKQLVMEHFYRWMRKRDGVLLTAEGQPEGGQWNFDKENRKSLGPGSPDPPNRLEFPPDALTREVMALVKKTFPDAPGSLEEFLWPTNREQALEVLDDFIAHRLAYFGDYQDAMDRGRPWMFHSLLSPVLNLKLLEPRECVAAAVEAYRQDRAPLNAVEGFIRQIIGWREFIRGVYWHEGPEYADHNHLDTSGRLPAFYWTGDTEMVCVQDSLDSVLRHGYGHHIQRLMVTGNLALTSGVDPREISDWYLGMYVDSMDWVTLPNTLGMVMFADGGVVGSKPYASTGKYIDRMSDYCSQCPFDPAQRSGPQACPFTTFYWDFLARNRRRLEAIPRMRMMYRNLDRLDANELRGVIERATELRQAWGIEQAVDTGV